jgi:hypothetical protein
MATSVIADGDCIRDDDISDDCTSDDFIVTDNSISID